MARRKKKAHHAMSKKATRGKRRGASARKVGHKKLRVSKRKSSRKSSRKSRKG